MQNNSIHFQENIHGLWYNTCLTVQGPRFNPQHHKKERNRVAWNGGGEFGYGDLKKITEKPLHRPVMTLGHELRSKVNSTACTWGSPSPKKPRTETSGQIGLEDHSAGLYVGSNSAVLELAHFSILLNSLWTSCMSSGTKISSPPMSFYDLFIKMLNRAELCTVQLKIWVH
jgi:hypothetical protein